MISLSKRFFFLSSPFGNRLIPRGEFCKGNPYFQIKLDWLTNEFRLCLAIFKTL